MDYPKFIVSKQKKESISIQRVNQTTIPAIGFENNQSNNTYVSGSSS